jgi:hypothetical protein
MPTLISEVDVRLERGDLDRRIVLPRQVDSRTGLIVPPARRPGLHLSGLLKFIAAKCKITQYTDQIAEEELPLRFAVGQSWEEFAASLYPDMIWQPQEMTEPLIMNCDGLSFFQVGEMAVEEFKFSRARKTQTARFLDQRHNWLKLHQGMGYCLGYGTDLVRWHVLSAFEFPDPVYTTYLVRFSQLELDGMQRIIDSNRDAAVEEGYAE